MVCECFRGVICVWLEPVWWRIPVCGLGGRGADFMIQLRVIPKINPFQPVNNLWDYSYMGLKFRAFSWLRIIRRLFLPKMLPAS